MAGTGKAKAKSQNLEVEQELRREVESREEQRIVSEQISQQVLNQGMDTGTHSSTHRGVDWGSSYSLKPDLEQASPTREQIELRAYELYLQRGCQDGWALEDWLAAEEDLKKR